MKRLRIWWLWLRSFLPSAHKRAMREQATYTRGYDAGWKAGRMALLAEQRDGFTVGR